MVTNSKDCTYSQVTIREDSIELEYSYHITTEEDHLYTNLSYITEMGVHSLLILYFKQKQLVVIHSGVIESGLGVSAVVARVTTITIGTVA